MFCKLFMVIPSALFISYLGLAAGVGVTLSGQELQLTQRSQVEERSWVEDNDQVDTVKVIEKATKQPLAKTAVRIFRPNTIRCIAAPCPQNDIEWSGDTDAKGKVRVPTDVMNRSKGPGPVATFATAGHVGLMDLTKDLKRIGKASWVIALSAQPTGQDSSSRSTNGDEEIPGWLSKRIEKEKSGPPANPPAKMFSYTYRDQRVYYIPPRCCDISSQLYNRDGDLLCLPDGGMTGRGDGKCSDFFKERKDEKLIWKDTRTRR